MFYKINQVIERTHTCVPDGDQLKYNQLIVDQLIPCYQISYTIKHPTNHILYFISTTLLWVARLKMHTHTGLTFFLIKKLHPSYTLPHPSILPTIIHNNFHTLHPKTNFDQEHLSSRLPLQWRSGISFSKSDSSVFTQPIHPTWVKFRIFLDQLYVTISVLFLHKQSIPFVSSIQLWCNSIHEFSGIVHTNHIKIISIVTSRTPPPLFIWFYSY